MRKKSKKQEEKEGTAEEPEVQDVSKTAEGEGEEPAANAKSDDKARSAEEELQELKDRLQRTAAELMNYRKQTEKRQKDMRLFVRRDVFEQILPIVDNFGAAMKAMEQGQDAENVLIGVKMIHEMLEKLLQDNGIKPISAKDQPFDPRLHEAVSREEVADVEPNTVVNEISRGYTMGDLVLRHARVVVAAEPEENKETEEDPAEPQENNGEDQES